MFLKRKREKAKQNQFELSEIVEKKTRDCTKYFFKIYLCNNEWMITCSLRSFTGGLLSSTVLANEGIKGWDVCVCVCFSFSFLPQKLNDKGKGQGHSMKMVPRRGLFQMIWFYLVTTTTTTTTTRTTKLALYSTSCFQTRMGGSMRRMN